MLNSRWFLDRLRLGPRRHPKCSVANRLIQASMVGRETGKNRLMLSFSQPCAYSRGSLPASVPGPALGGQGGGPPHHALLLSSRREPLGLACKAVSELVMSLRETH